MLNPGIVDNFLKEARKDAQSASSVQSAEKTSDEADKVQSKKTEGSNEKSSK